MNNVSSNLKWARNRVKKRYNMLHTLYLKDLFKPNRFVVYTLVGIVILFFLGKFITDYIYKIRAAENDVTVTLTPNKTQFLAQEELNLAIRLNTQNTANKKISGADLEIHYIADLFDYVAGSAQQTPAGYFNDRIKEEIQTVNGEKRLILTYTAKKADEQLSGVIQLNLKFKAKKEGQAKFAVVTDSSQVVGTDNTKKEIEYTLVPKDVAVYVTVGGAQYIHQGFITADGKELWGRDCPLLVTANGNELAGSPNSPLCSEWKKTTLTNLIASNSQEQTYSSYGTYVFKDKDNKKFVRESLMETAGKNIWYRNCNLDPDGRINGCTNWQSEDITIMNNPAAYDGYITPFGNNQELTVNFLNTEGNKMWIGVCSILTENNETSKKLAGDPNIDQCKSIGGRWTYIDLYTGFYNSDSALTGKTFKAYSVHAFTGDNNKTYIQESLIVQDGRSMLTRNCEIDSEATLSCISWKTQSLVNLRGAGNESYGGYSTYTYVRSLNSGPACTTDANCGPNTTCEGGFCTCKPQYFNCDGNWENGCEQSTSCSREVVNLKLKLKFQGIIGKPADKYNELRVKVTVKGPRLTTPQVAYGNFKANSTGIWEGTVPVPGVLPGDGYALYIKGPKHLQRKICTDHPTETEETPYECAADTSITLVSGDNNLDFSGIYQWAGDLPFDGWNQNGIIDSVDFAFIKKNFVSKDEESLHSGDLNLDGFVGAQDYSIPVAIFKLERNEDED